MNSAPALKGLDVYEVRQSDKTYRCMGIICEQEKDIIIDMINQIKQSIIFNELF